jgi:recombination protein RecR
LRRVEYPAAIKALIAELKRMPGIGPRSAERIALWMIQSRDARPQEIARALSDATTSIHPCAKCGFFTNDPFCEICSDPARDATQLCVVEQPTDVLPLERTGAFAGATTLSADGSHRWIISGLTICGSAP